MLRPQPSISPADRRLLQAARGLDEADRQTLIAFAEFLASRRGPATAPIAEPTREPRPEKESVVAAIKRLRRTFPMLDSGDLLDETSTLMSAHILQGVAANEVIDQLEVLFATRYQGYREQLDAVADGTAAPEAGDRPTGGD